MYTVLMALTALAVVALVAMLVYYLQHIIAALKSIGGDGNSYLAKLRLGLRAIERETGHLPGQVTKLNSTLTATAEGLKTVDRHLAGTIEAVLRQGNKNA